MNKTNEMEKKMLLSMRVYKNGIQRLFIALYGAGAGAGAVLLLLASGMVMLA